MKKLFFLSAFVLCLLAGTQFSYAQSGHKNYSIVTTQEPAYPGGNEALYTFFYNEMEYPADAKEKKVEGDVYVSFFVETDSTVSDVQVMSDPGYGMKDEAIRLIKLCKFVPGQQNGKPARMNLMLPVLFRIYD